MGDVYEEQNRYDQFLQQALSQGNANESMDLSFYNRIIQIYIVILSVTRVQMPDFCGSKFNLIKLLQSIFTFIEF